MCSCDACDKADSILNRDPYPAGVPCPLCTAGTYSTAIGYREGGSEGLKEGKSNRKDDGWLPNDFSLDQQTFETEDKMKTRKLVSLDYTY